MDNFAIGDTIPLNWGIDEGSPTDVSTVTVAIRRRSNGKYLDFADNTFKAAGTAATQSQALSISASMEWLYLWDSTGLNDGGVLTGKQNLSIEFTVDSGLVYIDDLSLGYGGGGTGGGATTTEISALLTSGITVISSAQLNALTSAMIAAMDAEGFLKAIIPTDNEVDVNSYGEVASQGGGPGGGMSLSDTYEGSESIQTLFRILRAALAGQTTGNGTTFKSIDGTKNRIVAEVDSQNNRTTVTVDGS